MHVAKVSWRRRAPEHCFDWWALMWGFRIELPAMCHSEADAPCISAPPAVPALPSSEWVSCLGTPQNCSKMYFFKFFLVVISVS